METETAAIDTRRKGRMGGLDTLRGLALIAMASYHFTWNLEYFGYLEPGTATTGLWKLALCACHCQLVPVPRRFQPVSRPWQSHKLAVLRQAFCNGGGLGAAHHHRYLCRLSG